MVGEERLHVPGENAARSELVAVSRFGQIRFAPEPLGGALDGVFERPVLERVQRIVMNENADRSLSRQQVGQSIDDAGERMVGRARLASVLTMMHVRATSG